jgi:hypothetical protein
MPAQFRNNATGTLAASILSSATTIVLSSTQGALFPTLAAGQYFYGTLFNTAGNYEIVKVTARAGDNLTVIRGQEGTTAIGFSAGDGFAQRLTAASLNNFSQLDADNTFTGNNTFSGTTSVAGISASGAATLTTLTASGDSAFNGTGALKIPVGTNGQRPTPATGMVRFSSTDVQFEGYNGSQWTSIGGAAAGGAVYENKQSITANYTMSTNYNGESVGPIQIDGGVTVTIPSGSRWVVL